MANTNNLEVYLLSKWLLKKLINTVQRAIELVKLAISEDEKHSYAEAYKYYQNALDYFMLALKCKPPTNRIIHFQLILFLTFCSRWEKWQVEGLDQVKD